MVRTSFSNILLDIILLVWNTYSLILLVSSCAYMPVCICMHTSFSSKFCLKLYVCPRKQKVSCLQIWSHFFLPLSQKLSNSTGEASSRGSGFKLIKQKLLLKIAGKKSAVVKFEHNSIVLAILWARLWYVPILLSLGYRHCRAVLHHSFIAVLSPSVSDRTHQ